MNEAPKIRQIPMVSGETACMVQGEGWPGSQPVALMRVMVRRLSRQQKQDEANHKKCRCPGVACPVHGLPLGSASGGW